MTATENDLPVMFMHGKDPTFGGIAAGWITKKVLEKDRIAVEVKFTDRALDHLRKGELAYSSPGLDVEQLADGSVEPYDGYELSLTNTPLIDGQQRIAADRDGGDVMDMKKFAKLAGVAEDATEDQILEALGKKLTRENAAGTGEISEQQLERLATRVSSAIGLDKLTAKMAEQAKDLVAAGEKKRRVEALLERAMADGKIVAAERKVTVDGKEIDPVRLECENNPDAFEARLKVMPRKAPVLGAFPKGGHADSADEGAPGSFAEANLADTQTRVNLDRAARALVAAKKADNYDAALTTLTRAQ